MRFTEHAILRRLAQQAAAFYEAMTPQKQASPEGRELMRWLTVLGAWDAEHPAAAEPRLPLLEGPKDA
ncbi:MAG: hypothetical protein IVW56_09530 [Candidatus Binataceae bacterium]|nr:hypothetical protein [Candidatus Binataceae bacterium]